MPFAIASKKIKPESKTKKILFAIMLNHTTLGLFVRTPKTNATIKPISIAKNSHSGIVKSPFLLGKIEFCGNSQFAKNTTNAAASKIPVSKIGLIPFGILISNTS
jgi:hypothetical protein